MNNGMTDLLEAQTSRLALAVQQAFGPNCPCCGRPMRVPRGRKDKQRYNGRDRRTIAHDFPVARGGSQKVWVYACRGCNSDQGDMTFWLWAKYLARVGDERAGRVFRLAQIIYTHKKEFKDARAGHVEHG